jgi:5-methylcytosine-specific restriction enzyme A
MPPRPSRPCAYPLCPDLVVAGYCAAHRVAASSSGFGRGTANERGYDYEWQQFRLRYLREHPLCVDCMTHNHVRLATDVHHTIKLRYAPERRFDETILMALCGDCHKSRTAAGQ